jgi:hypothetical protein
LPGKWLNNFSDKLPRSVDSHGDDSPPPVKDEFWKDSDLEDWAGAMARPSTDGASTKY